MWGNIWEDFRATSWNKTSRLLLGSKRSCLDPWGSASNPLASTVGTFSLPVVLGNILDIGIPYYSQFYMAENDDIAKNGGECLNFEGQIQQNAWQVSDSNSWQCQDFENPYFWYSPPLVIFDWVILSLIGAQYLVCNMGRVSKFGRKIVVLRGSNQFGVPCFKNVPTVPVSPPC